MSAARQLLAPRFWGYHLVALVLVAIAVRLGVWQVEAWQAQRERAALDLTRIQPIELTEAMGPDDPFPGKLVGHPVVIKGTWMPESTLLISNRKQDGQEGYWVAAPVTVGDAALMVVRGWTTDPKTVPAPPTGVTEMVVFLQPGEGTGAVDDDPMDDVLPQLRIADVLNHVDRDLYGAYGVVADEVAEGDWPVGDAAVNPGTDGLEPATLDQLPKSKASTALRNLLYGIEWWIFGLFAAYIWWRWVRDEKEKLEETQVTDAEPETTGPTSGSVDSQP